MKETTKTSRAVGQLEKMFRELNKDLFSGELEDPIITIAPTPSAYGHVTVSKVWKRKDDWRHELNFGAETIDRPIENITATMIHEMVHLYNIAHNVQDCSRGGTYHNKHFKEEAEKRMLKIEKHEKYGWTITSPTDELLEYLLSKDWEEIRISRGMPFTMGGIGTGGKATPGKPDAETPTRRSSIKYQCPKCRNSVRATKQLSVICGTCKVEMEDVG